MSRKMKTGTRNKIFIALLLMIVFFSICSNVAEAGALDSVRSAWGSMRTFVFSGKFWVNALIVFAVIFILQLLLLRDMMRDRGDTSTKVIMYILVGVIALVIASKFVGTGGQPEYLWQNEQVRNFVQFLLGPSTPRPACTAEGNSFIRRLFAQDPTPPCCGAGAYLRTVQGERVCRQALLRTNEDGSGLPAFIIAAILFYLLFSGYKKSLGIDSMGDKSSKWFVILLSLILAGMMANQRVTKGQIIMIGGWLAVVLIGSKLSKSLSGKDDPKGEKKGFGFGLAFAFVQLVANMLGSSLFGGTFEGEITTFTILKNFILGILVGMAYAAIVGEGIMDNIVSGLRKKQVADVEALTKRAVEKGGLLNYFKPFIRAIPLIGRLIKSPAEVETEEQKVNRLTSQLDRLLQRLHGDQNLTPAQQFDIQNQINALERELMALRGIQVGPVQGRQQQDEEQRRRTILELARQLQQQEQPQQPQQPHGAPPHH
jgi:hypothetical protein